jgi:hypothetical protein
MKKNVLLAAALMTSMFAVAQEAASTEEVVGRKGQPVLPKAGDIALGFNAFPVIDMLVQAAKIGSNSNNSQNSANTVQFAQNAGQNIVGKYFLDATSAVRFRFGLNSTVRTDRNLVQDSKAAYDASLSNIPEEVLEASLLRVEDVRYNKNNQFTLALGYEKRRGYRRLVGFYGAEIGFSRANAKAEYTYGNDFSDTYDTQFTTDFNSPFGGFTSVSTQQYNAAQVSRPNSIKVSGAWAFGARGFIGVEYFVFPKISIAAEYGFGYSFGATKRLTRNQETYLQGATGAMVVKQEEIEIESPDASRGFGVDNGANSVFNRTSFGGSSASLTLLFHF